MAIYGIDGTALSTFYGAKDDVRSVAYDIDGDILNISGVQSYFVDGLETAIAKTKAIQTDSCLTFAVITDVHFASVDTVVFPHSLENIKAFSEAVHLDGILCMGDMTDGELIPDNTSALLDLIMPMMRDVGLPVYFCAGNHDCNAYGASANVYTTEQMYQNYYRFGSHDVYFDAGSYCVNFFKDFDEQKIRMISLDSAKSDNGSANHYNYPMNTVNWFVNTAMATLPQDYSVLLVTHLSPIAEHNWKETVPINHADVEQALRDFVGNGGKVVCIMGHSHADFDFTSPWLDIAVYCNKLYRYTDVVITEETASSWLLPVGSKIWAREMGTYKEDTWDIAVINTQEETVDMIRFGAGEDRYFTY